VCISYRELTRLWTVRVRVTLRLTVSQSVCLGVEPRMGLMTTYSFWLKVTVLSIWGALSDERSGLSLSVNRKNSGTYIAEERTRFTGNTSRDHHPPLRDFTADTENTISSIVACAYVRHGLLLLRAGTCLRSCGLAMGIHVTVSIIESSSNKSVIIWGCKFSWILSIVPDSVNMMEFQAT
jgi:hypothetical protein